MKVLNPYHGGTSERMVWMEYTDAHNSLYHYLKDMGQRRMEERDELIAGLHTLADWKTRQGEVRKILQTIVGPFPAKRPLNAQITSTLERPEFTVEKVLFESMPGYKVTACLFLPKDRDEKIPAILFCSGHSANGFRYETYQNVILNLVQKGFIVFAFDPIGQGERLQYFDAEIGGSRVGGATREHSYANNQCYISGSSVARYFIWDGIRALDYLASRPEVDADRLGCHGNSGGGTQTAYISAMDDRIKVAAVSGYLTNFKWIIRSLGVQDGEQNLYQSWAHGFDLPDLIEVRAPKPMLMMVTTRDFFPIRGAREAYAEAKHVYEVYHRPDNLQKVEDDSEHGYTQKTRETLYAFFQQHLALPGDAEEEKVDLFTDAELTVTKTGQVSTGQGSETVFSINKKETQLLLDRLKTSRKNPERHCESVLESVPGVCGYPYPNEKEIDAVMTGRLSDNLVIEKYFIDGVGDYPIPFVLMIPQPVNKKSIVLYLDPDGKNVDSDNQYFYQAFLNNGHMVVIPDLINTGEVGPTEFRGDAVVYGISSNIWYMSVQNAAGIVGLRAADVNRLVSTLRTRFPNRPIAGASCGHFNTVLLHAAAMNPQIKALALLEPLLSYESMVMNEFYSMENLYAAPAGVLQSYDLADLAACLAPYPMMMVNPRDQNQEPVSKEKIDSTYTFSKVVYQSQNAKDKLIIKNDMETDAIENLVAGWLE